MSLGEKAKDIARCGVLLKGYYLLLGASDVRSSVNRSTSYIRVYRHTTRQCCVTPSVCQKRYGLRLNENRLAEVCMKGAR